MKVRYRSRWKETFCWHSYFGDTLISKSDIGQSLHQALHNLRSNVKMINQTANYSAISINTNIYLISVQHSPLIQSRWMTNSCSIITTPCHWTRSSVVSKGYNPWTNSTNDDTMSARFLSKSFIVSWNWGKKTESNFASFFVIMLQLHIIC